MSQSLTLSVFSLPALAMAVVATYVGLSRLLISRKLPQQRLHLSFGISALATIPFDVGSIGLYNAGSFEEAYPFQVLQMLSAPLAIVALYWFCLEHAGARLTRGFKLVSVTLLLITLVGALWPRLLVDPDMTHAAFKSIHVPALGRLILYEGGLGWLGELLSILLALTIGRIWLRAAQRSRAEGAGARDRAFFLAMSAFGLVAFNDLLVGLGVLPSMYLIEYAYLGFVSVMALALSNDLLDGDRARRAQLEAEEALQEARHLESLGRMARGVAHDFKNTLTPILARAELIQVELGEDAPQQDQLERIRRAALQGKRLVDQLLTYACQRELQRAPLELNLLIEEQLEFLRSGVADGITVSARLSEEPCLISADATQIRRVLMNLVFNASHAIEGEGEIHIEARRLKRWVSLYVKDDGCGMSPETAARIFEPFFSTKRERGGTGLGLSTVHGIVTQHGGRVEVESAEGQGSTFKIFFEPLEAAS